MKLQFKVQQYQTDAVDAVVDVFTGQPFADGVKYRIDPGKEAAQTMMEDAGQRNAEIALTPPQLMTNVHQVQRARGLELSKDLKDPVKKSAAPINLDIEMETGTGKTYVYIKTIMELHKRYGWSKYIVVVPSIAIREGVQKSFDITAEHFQQMYGTKPRTFIYNSSRLHELERFSSDSGVQVMIINSQAFNATGKDARRIYEVLDDFQSRKPIDVIAANRPILIIDEPQKIEGDAKKPSKSLEALGLFDALFALRYSATHKIERTKVHRLDAVDAYNQKLVKKIAVRDNSVLASIDKANPSQIIFELRREDGLWIEQAMTAAYKRAGGKTKGTDYFRTGWIGSDEPRIPLPAALDMDGLYSQLLGRLLPHPIRPAEELSDALDRMGRARKLIREVAALEKKLRTEPQLNRKIGIRRQIKERTAVLAELTDPVPSNKE